MRRGFLHAMAMALPGIKYAVVRRNMPDLRKNHLIYLGAEMRALGGRYHETHGIADYGNGSLGFYQHCEEEADVEKIVGSEVAILFVDEAPQIRWEFLRTISPSLRVPRAEGGRQPYYTLEVYSGNPMGESIEELDKYFLTKDVDPEADPEYQPDDWQHLPIHLTDNPSLDPVEYRRQFAGIPAHFRSAWIDGVRMESRAMFTLIETKDGRPYHVIDELPTVDGVPLLQVPWIQVYRAFDMGYFPDPAVCLWIAVLGPRVIVVHEAHWFRTIAKDLATAIIRTTEDLIGATPVSMTYVDPQIAIKTGSDTVTVMDTLEMHGVPCEPSINDRVLYADAIHGLLGEEVAPGVPKTQFYRPGCPTLVKYLPKMRWDEKNPRKLADHKFDHTIVCTAYFAISSGVLARTEATTPTREPVWMQWLADTPTRGHARHRRLRS
jgi:hypothetical protein